MNPPTETSRVFRRWIFLCAALALPGLAAAQGPAAARAAEVKANLQRQKNNLAQSAAHYGAGQAAAAEQTLLADSLHKVGTAGWRHEAGVKCYSMALHLRSVGQEATARLVIAQALHHLDVAVSLAQAKGDPIAAAAAHQLAGAIQDVFLGDIKSALSRVQEAKRLNPNGKNVNHELARLTRADEQTSARKPGK
jgi:hypothetical protein